MVKPITPNEVSKEKINVISEHMIQAVNNMIIKNWNGQKATVFQKEIVKEYFKISGNKKTVAATERLFKENQLDIEPLFETVGWKVDYDKPAYNENYDAFFVFKRKNNKE